MPIQDIGSIETEFCRNFEYFFTDIDDTITTDGMMPVGALEDIWKLSKAGIKVILVTGRPAGWCDYFARMWPVAGIIGENGAFYFTYNRTDKKMKRVYLQTDAVRKAGKEGLERISRRVLSEVPGCGISADQPFRIADLAIDFCEDVPTLSDDSINKICRIIEEEGAVYKVSSIHINCWFGDYDKLTCFDRFLMDFTDSHLAAMQEKIIYIGDSPNDEPMFEKLKYSAAVNNIVNFLDRMEHYPAYKSSLNSGEGFREIVRTILTKRGY
ncbi:MAG: HAD-IIB family hydrolase [Spirochaetales bacterium]|nr:HAD-IIB family hydrolase [Spirochaetales bacterium]